MAEGQQRVQCPAGIEPIEPSWGIARLTATRLNYLAMTLCRSTEKTVYDLSYFAFCVKDCDCQIVPVQYQGQTRCAKFLDSKPLVDTYYRTGHNWS